MRIIMSRREFIEESMAGTAIIALPFLFSGCGTVKSSGIIPDLPPGLSPVTGTYFSNFGIDTVTIGRVLAKAMSR